MNDCPVSFRSKLSNYFLSRDRGWILSLLLAASLVYLPFLGSPFVFDDVGFFAADLPAHYARSSSYLQLRWLPYATLGWTEMAFSSVVTHFYHLGNLLLHAANVILLFYLLRQLAAAAIPENRLAAGWGAWFGALIFALHPVAVYAVGYAVQRSILMATLFSLVMLLAYVRALLTGRARWLVLAALAYFLAVFSKEHSVMMPAVLAAVSVVLRGTMVANARSLWLSWGAFAAIGLLIILRAQGVFGTPYEAMAADLFKHEGVSASGPGLYLLSVFTQAGLFFKYLLLWLFPNPACMSVDMREPFVSSLGAWQGWLGAVGFSLYGIAGVALLLRKGSIRLAGLAMLYPWLQFLVEFSSIRVQEPFVLYRSYLWMPGLLLLVPLLLSKWPGRKTLVALGAAALLLAPLAVNRLWVFADNYRLWNDAARLLPDERIAGADRIFFNRGQAEEGRGQLGDAVADFQRVLAISPQYAPVHFELGWVYLRTGRHEDAMAQFDAAIANDPKYAPAYYGKAMVMKMRHEHAAAAELMAKSCELKSQIACLIVKGHIEH